MMQLALAALAAGAIAGIFLATRHFLRKRLPVWVALLHGLGGATGFTCVLLVVVSEPAYQLARQALYLLIATIVLGSINLLFHVRRVRHRTSLIVMHALCAISGVSTIGYAVFFAEPAASAVAQPGAAAAQSAAAPAVLPAPLPPKAAVAPATSPPDVPGAPAAASPGSEAAGDRGDALALDPAVQRVLAETVSFATNSGVPDEASLKVVAAVAGVLKEHHEIGLIQVQGHADERGSDAYNVALTRQRAEAVVDLLEAQGVARERLHGAGFGARCPASPDCAAGDALPRCRTLESLRRDRRVIFVPLRVGGSSFHGPLVCGRGAGLIPADDRRYHTSQR